jgi:hypothetical protein
VPAPSADVALDRVDVAHLGAVRVVAELALRAALAQQVPALVELFLEVADAGLRIGGCRRRVLQPVLSSISSPMWRGSSCRS